MNADEMVVVPNGVKHKPHAPYDVKMLLNRVLTSYGACVDRDSSQLTNRAE